MPAQTWRHHSQWPDTAVYGGIGPFTCYVKIGGKKGHVTEVVVNSQKSAFKYGISAGTPK